MTENQNSDKLTKIAGLLDFYSNRAVAHASFFLASIFGLVAFSAIIDSTSSALTKLTPVAFILFFGFAYAGYHALIRFNFYATLSQRIAETGLDLETTLMDTVFSVKADGTIEENNDKRRQRYCKFMNEQKKILILPPVWDLIGDRAVVIKRHKIQYASIFLWLLYWVGISLLGTLAFSEIAGLAFMGLFSLGVLFTVLSYSLELYNRKKTEQHQGKPTQC